MTSELGIFAARLREFISFSSGAESPALQEAVRSDPSAAEAMRAHADAEFSGMALVLFALQFKRNESYRKFCEARRVSPDKVGHWTDIPAVPTSAFKEFDLTCLAPAERTTVFHSSGTTAQRPSRHFHSAESLALYEASLLPWLLKHVLPPGSADRSPGQGGSHLLLLTPPPSAVPHSSLVHMFDTLRRHLREPESVFAGQRASDNSWALDLDRALNRLSEVSEAGRPLLVMGTAFSFVHLLDFLGERNCRCRLPAGSRVLETGGYKGRSRSLPKGELHALITDRLGVSAESIVCEYGMSELSSQAYASPQPGSGQRPFLFPPWAQARVVSPETGLEVPVGGMGLLRIHDLANVFSVMAIETEDMAVRHDDGFELLGRAERAEPRGCSLMNP